MEEPIVKQGEPLDPVSTIYQYVPTEPVIPSPYVEVIDTKQAEINKLKTQVEKITALLQSLE